MSECPFSNGTQAHAWKARNCERCAKGYVEDDEDGWHCDLEQIIDEGFIGCVERMTPEFLRRMGYTANNPPAMDGFSYTWDCPERESTEPVEDPNQLTLEGTL